MQRELYNSNRIQEGFQEHPSKRLNQLNPSNTLAALEGISFRYDPKEDLVLEDFSLSIGEGEISALEKRHVYSFWEASSFRKRERF